MEADRRRLAKRLVLALDVVAALAASVLFVLGFLAPSTVGVDLPGGLSSPFGNVLILSLVTSEAKLVFISALIVLTANVLYLLYARRLRSPLRHVTSEVQGGPVHVARDAIEAGLRNAGETLHEVARLRVLLANGGPKRVLARVQYQSPEGTSVHEATRLLRHALEQRFAEMVHLGEGSRVDWEIEFVGFVPLGKAQKKPTPLVPLDRPDESFTGPRYPIDDEDPYGTRKHG